MITALFSILCWCVWNSVLDVYAKNSDIVCLVLYFITNAAFSAVNVWGINIWPKLWIPEFYLRCSKHCTNLWTAIFDWVLFGKCFFAIFHTYSVAYLHKTKWNNPFWHFRPSYSIIDDWLHWAKHDWLMMWKIRCPRPISNQSPIDLRIVTSQFKKPNQNAFLLYIKFISNMHSCGTLHTSVTCCYNKVIYTLHLL